MAKFKSFWFKCTGSSFDKKTNEYFLHIKPKSKIHLYLLYILLKIKIIHAPTIEEIQEKYNKCQ